MYHRRGEIGRAQGWRQGVADIFLVMETFPDWLLTPGVSFPESQRPGQCTAPRALTLKPDWSTKASDIETGPNVKCKFLEVRALLGSFSLHSITCLPVDTTEFKNHLWLKLKSGCVGKVPTRMK